MKITCSCGALIFSDGYLDPDTYIKRFLDMHKPCREAYVKFIKKIDETAYASGFDEVSERLEALEEAEHHVPQKKEDVFSAELYELQEAIVELFENLHENRNK